MLYLLKVLSTSFETKHFSFQSSPHLDILLIFSSLSDTFVYDLVISISSLHVIWRVCECCYGNQCGRDVIANEFFFSSSFSLFFPHRKLEHDESFSSLALPFLSLSFPLHPLLSIFVSLSHSLLLPMEWRNRIVWRQKLSLQFRSLVELNGIMEGGILQRHRTSVVVSTFSEVSYSNPNYRQ